MVTYGHDCHCCSVLCHIVWSEKEYQGPPTWNIVKFKPFHDNARPYVAIACKTLLGQFEIRRLSNILLRAQTCRRMTTRSSVDSRKLWRNEDLWTNLRSMMPCKIDSTTIPKASTPSVSLILLTTGTIVSFYNVTLFRLFRSFVLLFFFMLIFISVTEPFF